MLLDGARSDIYSIVERVGDWDSRMREYGFSSGCSYKRFLLDSGRINSVLEEKYDLLTVEGWKEVSSERIGWENLPTHFDWKGIALPYRSSHLTDAHAKIVSLAGVCDLADIRSERWRLTFPYHMLIDQVRALSGEVDASFRMNLVSSADDETMILASRSLGVNPVSRAVGFKEVKRVVEEFCQERGLAKLSNVRPTKNGFVYGREFGNGLVLCLSVYEVRSFPVEGKHFYRVVSSFNLVRNDQYLNSWGWPKDFPWAGLPELSIYPAYGLKVESSVAFYVNLSYILLSFQFWCEAFDSFFETRKPEDKEGPGF